MHKLTKQEAKLIRSLARKTERDESGLFVAEGVKALTELLPRFRCRLLVGTERSLLGLGRSSDSYIERVALIEGGFSPMQIGNFRTAHPLLAVFEKPRQDTRAQEEYPKESSLLLDGVQDPGNVGTIIRTANWFGIRRIYFTEGTADPFGPKAVQACMGALSGVMMVELSRCLETIERWQSRGIRLIGSFLEAPSLYATTLPPTNTAAVLIVGNEGKGISPEVAGLCDTRVHIPAAVRSEGNCTESLNVSVATGIILSHWLG